MMQAVILAGAIPRFVDVCPFTFGYNVAELKSKINELMETDLSDHYGIEATILFRQ
jgi:dTDP-4-amino-4,6-dideoxygalactose transaminase